MTMTAGSERRAAHPAPDASHLLGAIRPAPDVPFDLALLEAASAACKYRVNDLAQILGISPRHLRRVFARWLGCRPNVWLREARLQAARRLLLSAGSVKAVAIELDYRQPSQFCRDFRARFGCTPSEWLRSRAACSTGAGEPED